MPAAMGGSGGAGQSGSVLAIDPGRDKCGVAVVDRARGVLFRGVVSRQRLVDEVTRLVREYAPGAVVLGDRTASRLVERDLAQIEAIQRTGGIRRVDEQGTSRLARARYWSEHPPRGLWRLVPVGLRVPPVPLDDLAAVILAERYLKQPKGSC